MERTVIYTPNAPKPIGPYSQAIQYGDLLYISGQIPINPATGEVVKESLEMETRQVMENLQAILHEAGMDFCHVMKTTIFLMDMAKFPEVNTEYARYFEKDPPARETVQVAALPLKVNVEISMIAGK
jgi:2-iminobutanoate/2-iminopropanoate deaminase